MPTTPDTAKLDMFFKKTKIFGKILFFLLLASFASSCKKAADIAPATQPASKVHKVVFTLDTDYPYNTVMYRIPGQDGIIKENLKNVKHWEKQFLVDTDTELYFEVFALVSNQKGYLMHAGIKVDDKEIAAKDIDNRCGPDSCPINNKDIDVALVHRIQ